MHKRGPQAGVTAYAYIYICIHTYIYNHIVIYKLLCIPCPRFVRIEASSMSTCNVISWSTAHNTQCYKRFWRTNENGAHQKSFIFFVLGSLSKLLTTGPRRFGVGGLLKVDLSSLRLCGFTFLFFFFGLFCCFPLLRLRHDRESGHYDRENGHQKCVVWYARNTMASKLQ